MTGARSSFVSDREALAAGLVGLPVVAVMGVVIGILSIPGVAAYGCVAGVRAARDRCVSG